MSLRPTITQSFKSSVGSKTCIFCLHRTVQPVRRYAVSKASKAFHKVQPRKTHQELRDDIDRRNRIGFFTLLKNDRMIFLEPNKADQLISDFETFQTDKVDPASSVQQLAKKHNVKVGDITYLAIPLLRVPDVRDQNAQLPPSQNPSIAARILVACSAARDVMATIQILNAIYLSRGDDVPQAQNIARLFTNSDINRCKDILDELAMEGDSYALTLQGQFLERAGQKEQAGALYEKALEKCNPKFDPAYPHPMALPIVQPWMAFSSLKMSQNTPDARAKAKVALEKGAFKGDDPLAYYQLASFEDGMTPNWLQYTSKAAASGHCEAMYKLGHFYMDLNSDPSTFLNNSRFKKALKFLTSWKYDSLQRFAKQWFDAAAAGGHKPAMLELVELYDAEGDKQTSLDYLRRMVEPPQAGKAEEWPRLVEQARKRLGGLKAPLSRNV